MSEETPNVTETPPPAKRQYRRRKKVFTPRMPRQEKQTAPLKISDEFAGMTEIKCPMACGIDRCIISGIAHCAHPKKGGLPAELNNDAAAAGRYERARKLLAHLRIDPNSF